jgi:hypothetical protein
LSSPLCKNILIFRIPKSDAYLLPSCPTEGRLEIVTDAGQDAVDASGAIDDGALLRTAKTCGPDASAVASSWRKSASDGVKNLIAGESTE